MVFVLNSFGIQTTSIVAVIGAAGLAIGLALQGTLSNLAAGVMLVLFRPFRVGDFVTAAGKSGTVKNITLIYTEMLTYDGHPGHRAERRGLVATSSSTTRSNPARMIDLTIGVAYEPTSRRPRRCCTR